MRPGRQREREESEGREMNGKQKRKNNMKYLAGVLFLLVSVFLAWILPESYGSWKDERMIGTVKLSGREEITFLDGKSLEAQERWQMLAEMDSGKQNMSVEIVDSIELENAVAEEYTVLWQKGMEIIRQYAMADLLPFAWQEQYFGLITMDWMVSEIVQFDKISIPMVCMHFYLQTAKGEISFTVLMDQELQLPYYVSAIGVDVWEGMAQEIGYASFENMYESLAQGKTQPEGKEKKIDFSAAFEMDSVELRQSSAGRLECDAAAYLDEIEIPVYRRMVEQKYYGEGIAICCGMQGWIDILRYVTIGNWSGDWEAEQSIGQSYVMDEQEYLIDTMVWKKRMGGGEE